MISCPSCHAPNDPSAGFCDQCGTKLAGAGPAVMPAQPAMPAAPAPFAGGGSFCPQCRAPYTPGELFCEQCGAALTGAAPIAPPMGGVAPVAQPVAPPPMSYQAPIAPPPIAPMPAYPAAPVAAARLVASSGQSFQLSGKISYLIGREDAVSGNYPDVDTGDAGLQAGVSRRHAELFQQGVQWFIKDLNSVNGAWVNNQRVAPNATQPLNPGDTIRLGKWSATFQV